MQNDIHLSNRPTSEKELPESFYIQPSGIVSQNQNSLYSYPKTKNKLMQSVNWKTAAQIALPNPSIFVVTIKGK